MTEESVVCDCGYRLRMSRERFREASTGAAGIISCPECNQELTRLITALQKAIYGGV